MEILENSKEKDWAKCYRAVNFIEKGVCTYQDEVVYLNQDTLEKCVRDIKGKPVIIKHQRGINPDNMQQHAVGYVTGAGFDEFNASFSCDFVLFDEEAKSKIANGWSVSCAYLPKAFGQGGTWHNTAYDREITDLEFTHLALVPDPRYEDAKVYENAKDEESYNKLKNEIEKNTQEKQNNKEDEMDVNEFISKITDGIVEKFNACKKNEMDEEEEKKKMDEEELDNEDDDKLEFEGETYSKKELVNAFKTMKKNEADAEAAKKVEKEKEEKENALGEEAYKKLEELLNSRKTDDESDKIKYESQADRIARGNEIFG